MLSQHNIKSGIAWWIKYDVVGLTLLSICSFCGCHTVFAGLFRVGSLVWIFRSFRGVRQGENLSPVLFALFLNDLETFLEEKNCTGINLEMPTDNISTYIKLFVLLYADDTVIFGTDEVSFQYNLNVFYEYSKAWKLDSILIKQR